MFNQSVKRYYVLFGWEQCELLVFEGVTDGQPFGRINTYKLSPDMAISVVERALTIVRTRAHEHNILLDVNMYISTFNFYYILYFLSGLGKSWGWCGTAVAST